MSDDERQVRDLVERWVAAVHAGDLEGIVADHSDDVVMYDVPPPSEAARGLDAYRAAWPGFVEWQRGGASFGLRSLEVTAGTDVAFAHALLHCAEPGAPDVPERRLRVTLGLRKDAGRWRIAHEHHSFPDMAASTG